MNIVTPPLFDRFPTPQDLASASFDEVYPYVKSVSYPNSKTEHLIAMAQKLLADFDGEVPSDIDALMTLPGVGRKTANVIASVVYDKPVIAVDTHVFRVSHRTWSVTFRSISAPAPTIGSSSTAVTPAPPAPPSARPAALPTGASSTPRSNQEQNSEGESQGEGGDGGFGAEGSAGEPVGTLDDRLEERRGVPS